ncbi:hypothetical protein L6164_035269 [Bauhinia variegata]|uniref:Uncharacterized protein n=1 Tax=Bauhinia variegata TaxID=167791 RepID=A0ACB9KX83_BAUVA|nr:hypothetical protein L6164_035269 [Bauhinia variegata]
MVLGYACVRWWKIFTPKQCAGVNTFVAVFAVPFLSFKLISSNDPYSMNWPFIAADSVQKLIIFASLFLWKNLSKNGSLEWMITLFSLGCVPNTLAIGLQLLRAMYGDTSSSLANAEIGSDGKLHVVGRKSSSFRNPQEPTNLMINGDGDGVEVYSLQSSQELSSRCCEDQLHMFAWGSPAASDADADADIKVITEPYVPGIQNQKDGEMPPAPASVMTKSVLIMVWRKLIRNSNTYSTLLGVAWSLVSSRGCVLILSNTGLGMAVFSLGLFVALQPKIIACGKSKVLLCTLVRFGCSIHCRWSPWGSATSCNCSGCSSSSNSFLRNTMCTQTYSARMKPSVLRPLVQWQSQGRSGAAVFLQQHQCQQGHGEGLTQTHFVWPVKACTCISLIKACSTLDSLKCVHAFMLRSHLHRNLFFSTNLVARYASLGSVAYASNLFSTASRAYSDVFLWNVMIRVLVDNALYHSSLTLYEQMRQLAIQPDNFTFPFVLKACAYLRNYQLALQLHAHVLRLSYHSDVTVANSLLTMYAKCGHLHTARHIFDNMRHKNVVSWSSIIGAFAQNGCFEEGLFFFSQMLDDRIRPNRAAILNAMACVQRENEARVLSRLMMENGLDLDRSVQNAAMRMYARSGRIDVARRFFDVIIDKDLVSWASMIESYARADMPLKALELFRQMSIQTIRPDLISSSGHCQWILPFAKDVVNQMDLSNKQEKIDTRCQSFQIQDSMRSKGILSLKRCPRFKKSLMPIMQLIC